MLPLRACRHPVNLTAHIDVIAGADSNYVFGLRHQWAVNANNQNTYTCADTSLTTHTGLGYKRRVIKVTVTFRAGEAVSGCLERNHNVELTS